MSDQQEAEEADVDDTTEPAVDAEEAAEQAADVDESAEQEADAEPETDAEEQGEGLQEGAFVEIEYTARTAEDGTLVDTTDREIAEEEGVETEGRTFGPRTIVLGAGHVFEPVEEAILGSEVGDEGEVVVSAGEAFGEYDEEQVRTVSAEKIPEDDRYPGAHVEVDGQHGHVETIIGGRARVDFNHPLAGEELVYEYEIVDVIEDRLEKARGLLRLHLDTDLEVRIETDEVEEQRLVEPEEGEAEADEGEAEADEGEAEEPEGEDEEAEAEEADEDEEPPEPEYETVTVEKETLYVESTPQLSFNQQWMFQKQQIAQELMDRLDLDRVIVQEVIDGSGGMMGGMGGMMPGMGAGGGVDLGEADLEEAEVDADDLVDELDEE